VIALALNTATVAVIAVLIGVILFAFFFSISLLRANRKLARAGEPAPKPVPVVSRRDFQRRALLSSVLLFSAEFGLGTVGFLWPNLRGGFGSKINAGSINDIKSFIEGNKQPFYVGQGRFYIIEWNGTPGAGQANYPALGVTTNGIMPLYQKCVHLGCRVPFCQQSQWFECPCHGSKYDGAAGEYQLGPAPRGLDRFPVEMQGDQVVVDTSTVVLGPPRGTNTINQPPQGPFCVATG
jgi:cytochrome b6-f complex iron-sulfur subunit